MLWMSVLTPHESNYIHQNFEIRRFRVTESPEEVIKFWFVPKFLSLPKMLLFSFSSKALRSLFLSLKLPCFFQLHRKMLEIREGVGITIFGQNVLSHGTEKFRGGNLQCYRKLRVSKFFIQRKEVSRFVEKFLSHRTEMKNFVGEPFCVSENFWYQKIYA